jgi:hypothetical protein
MQLFTVKRPFFGGPSFEWVRDSQNNNLFRLVYTGSDLDVLEAVEAQQPAEVLFVACVVLLALCHI